MNPATEPFLARELGHCAAAEARADLQQAAVCQALFEVMAENAGGPGNFDGVVSRGYWYPPDAWSHAFADRRREPQSVDKSSSTRAKPAEAAARGWFDRFAGQHSECLLSWAESRYPGHFPRAGILSQTWSPYRKAECL